jgi:prevent-host-death family protein
LRIRGLPRCGQRQLRNDNAEIMRRVEAGESFIITRHGELIADLTPHAGRRPRRRPTLRELQERRRAMRPPLDVKRWHADLAAAGELFGDDRIEY